MIYKGFLKKILYKQYFKIIIGIILINRKKNNIHLNERKKYIDFYPPIDIQQNHNKILNI